MTTKIYWENSKITDFTANVIESFFINEQQIVILDKTAFYPLGGGQPCDLGTINSIPIREITIDEKENIFHHLETPMSLPTGSLVTCQVDSKRRLEMTQQHTGQHILSQAFFQLFGAETRGFRITTNASEIDLNLDLPTEQIPYAIQRAEELANQVIFENRSIRTHLVTPEIAMTMPLRRESFVADCVRVIEIEDYDWSACGGTHAMQTGEVGIISVKGWERAKKMIRVEFLCGIRVLQDYRVTNSLLENIARKFSVGRNEAAGAVERLLEDHKVLERRNRALAESSAKLEAESLLRDADSNSNYSIIARIFAERTFDDIKTLAHQLIKLDNMIVLFALKDEHSARLVFAKSKNVTIDMGRLLREFCLPLGGKGGGTNEFAQGGIDKVQDLDELFLSSVKSLLEKEKG